MAVIPKGKTTPVPVVRDGGAAAAPGYWQLFSISGGSTNVGGMSGTTNNGWTVTFDYTLPEGSLTQFDVKPPLSAEGGRYQVLGFNNQPGGPGGVPKRFRGFFQLALSPGDPPDDCIPETGGSGTVGLNGRAVASVGAQGQDTSAMGAAYCPVGKPPTPCGDFPGGSCGSCDQCCK